MLYAINNNVSAGISKRQQIIEGNKNKAKGVVAGVLDLCYLHFNGRVIYLDAKVGKDIFSADQMDFIRKIVQRGHYWFKFSSFEEFKQLINTLRDG